MVYSTLLFITRLPSLTPDEFREYYETKHLPLIRSQAPEEWTDVSTTIRFVSYSAQTAEGGKETTYAPNMVVGEAGFCDFDAVVEYSFPDKQYFEKFFGAMYAEEIRRVREADEEKFIDRSKARLVLLS
jgi:hypothetical protein